MLGGPNLRYVRVESPLAQCMLIEYWVHVQSSLRDSGTLVYIFSIFLSSPAPDGPSLGTESNLPVSHPTPGIQIVDYPGSSRKGGGTVSGGIVRTMQVLG